jgi:hypothetical protein
MKNKCGKSGHAVKISGLPVVVLKPRVWKKRHD